MFEQVLAGNVRLGRPEEAEATFGRPVTPRTREPARRPAAQSATSAGSQRLLPGPAPSRDDRPGIQVPEGGQDLDNQTYLRHI